MTENSKSEKNVRVGASVEGIKRCHKCSPTSSGLERKKSTVKARTSFPLRCLLRQSRKKMSCWLNFEFAKTKWSLQNPRISQLLSR